MVTTTPPVMVARITPPSTYMLALVLKPLLWPPATEKTTSPERTKMSPSALRALTSSAVEVTLTLAPSMTRVSAPASTPSPVTAAQVNEPPLRAMPSAWRPSEAAPVTVTLPLLMVMLLEEAMACLTADDTDSEPSPWRVILPMEKSVPFSFSPVGVA